MMGKKTNPHSKTPHDKGVAKSAERRALLAAISILSVSLGVTAAESATGIAPTTPGATHDSRTKLAQEIQTNQLKTIRSNQLKTSPATKAALEAQQRRGNRSLLQSNQKKLTPGQSNQMKMLRSNQSKSPTTRSNPTGSAAAALLESQQRRGNPSLLKSNQSKSPTALSNRMKLFRSDQSKSATPVSNATKAALEAQRKSPTLQSNQYKPRTPTAR